MPYKSSIIIDAAKPAWNCGFNIGERQCGKWNHHWFLSLPTKRAARHVSSLARTNSSWGRRSNNWRRPRGDVRAEGRGRAGRKMTQFAGKVPRNTATDNGRAHRVHMPHTPGGLVWNALYNRLTMNCDVGDTTDRSWRLGGTELRASLHVMGTPAFNNVSRQHCTACIAREGGRRVIRYTVITVNNKIWKWVHVSCTLSKLFKI